MKTKRAVCLVSGALISSLCLHFFPAPAAAAPKRTLKRTEDFVVISGKEAGSLLGAETKDLRLYSCQGEECRPVPVQVDKVDLLGRYVFPQDLNFDRDGTRLDENDELSFMAGDAGDGLPEGFGPGAAEGGVEIELIDPVDGGRAWAYLFSEPGSKPPPLPDYVSYRVEGENAVIESGQFLLGLQQGRLQYDTMRMKGSAGELGQDVLDRQRVGLEAQTVGDVNMQISVPESIIKSNYAGVIDGPVRVIVDELVMVNVGAISFQWGAENFNKYYRCGQNNFVTFEFPGSARDLFKTILMYWGLDFTNEIIGSFYLDPNHADPIEIRDEERSEIPGDGSHYWWALHGPHGVVLQAIDLDDEIAPFFICEGRWRQNPTPKIRKGEHPGKLEIGFGCREADQVPDLEDYHWQNYILFPSDPSPRGINELIRIFQHPLKVSVKDLGP